MCVSRDCGKPTTLRDAMSSIAIGAYKLTKAFLGMDPASKSVVEARRAICRKCEYAVPCKLSPGKVCWCGPVWDGITGRRDTCGCNLEYKTMVAAEACPKHYWPAVNGAMAVQNPSNPAISAPQPSSEPSKTG